MNEVVEKEPHAQALTTNLTKRTSLPRNLHLFLWESILFRIQELIVFRIQESILFGIQELISFGIQELILFRMARRVTSRIQD